MRHTLLFFAFMLSYAATLAQNNITLVFSCCSADGQYVHPDSIRIMNLDRGWAETLLYPDTIYTLNVAGIETADAFEGKSVQVIPNPFYGKTTVNLHIFESADVAVEILDMNGRVVGMQNFVSLQPGIYPLHIALRNLGVYILTARVNGQTISTKLVNTGKGEKDVLEVNGCITSEFAPEPPNLSKGSSIYPFQLGDLMQYVAFASGDTSAELTQNQSESEQILLTFATFPPISSDGQPCPNAATVTDYDGNVYNTVQIGNQCWMKENMRTTHFSDGTGLSTSMYNYSLTDPYYYNYTSSGIPLEERGYLYNWTAAMRGFNGSDANPSGVQGVCPVGWHLPSDAEWTQLTDYVNSQSQYVCGSDNQSIAKSLASILRWSNSSTPCSPGYDSSTNDTTGFSVVPAGIWQFSSTTFITAGNACDFWSSSESGYYAGLRVMMYDNDIVYRYTTIKANGCSVRCLRD